MRFCASGADGSTISFLFFTVLQFRLDKHRWALVTNLYICFSISICYGQTEFYFPTCTKPCSLAAILWAASYQNRLTKFWLFYSAYDTYKKTACRNSEYQKVSFDFKLSIVDQIINGQISVNHAAKVYKISRSSITYWMRKLRSFEQKSKSMSKNEEIKKLRERIEALEFIKEIQPHGRSERYYCRIGGLHRRRFLKKVVARIIAQRDSQKEAKPYKVKRSATTMALWMLRAV